MPVKEFLSKLHVYSNHVLPEYECIRAKVHTMTMCKEKSAL